MILNKVLTEKLLQQAASELATALNKSLPPSNKCQHKFSDRFEEKIPSLIKVIGNTCYAVIIQDPAVHK